eukprot:c28391_g1_i1.p1 GENE.c28391_g1_i1~~c28391_g1_i1.p1  ORF type:complete len:336 (-),score=-26.10 c28391_g1_i1:67-1074(-)
MIFAFFFLFLPTIITKRRKLKIKRDEDILYGSDKTFHIMDHYYPAEDNNNNNYKINQKRRPVMIHIHGGAWVTGAKSNAPGRSLILHTVSTLKYSVFSINYRLAPQFRYPAPLDDVLLAIKHIYDNADFYNIDRDFITICGSSAGGQLACAATLLSPIPIKACIPVYAPLSCISSIPNTITPTTTTTNEIADAKQALPPLLPPLSSSYDFKKSLIFSFFYETLNDECHYYSQVDRLGSYFKAIVGDDCELASPYYLYDSHCGNNGYSKFFFIHGKNDALVSFLSSSRMASKIKKMSKDSHVFSVELPLTSHLFDFIDSSSTLLVNKAIQVFLSNL